MRFCVDVKIYGTAYVEAANIAEARALIIEAVGCAGEPSASLDLAARDIDLGNGVALSPVFTAYGMAEGADVEECGE